jgi:hypothetical protein
MLHGVSAVGYHRAYASLLSFAIPQHFRLGGNPSSTMLTGHLLPKLLRGSRKRASQ